MDETKQLRVLWIANSPSLSAGHLKLNVLGRGWIAALEEAVGQYSHCCLGLAFYNEEEIEPFELENTWYYPIKKFGNTKKRRFLNRLVRRAEYEENLPQLLRTIDLFKPDIIHVHGTEFPYGLIVKQIRSIPIVISIQGLLTVYEKKYFSGMNPPGFLQQLKSGYPFFQTDYKIWLKKLKVEQEILSKAEFIFGRTDWDRNICRILAPQAEYHHVEEVIRKEFYTVKWNPPSNAIPVLFTTSSTSLYKGFETILDAAAILTKLGFPFIWKVAGLGEQDALVKLTKSSRNIEDLRNINIQLLGNLSEKELPGSLLNSDIYIQVSHIENSPNSLCEAMLVGMPIIASFAGGTSSLLKDKLQGILVQDGDPFMLAGSIEEILGEPEKSRSMAEQAYQVAHLRHNPLSVVNDMLGKYNLIIKEKSAKNLLKI